MTQLILAGLEVVFCNRLCLLLDKSINNNANTEQGQKNSANDVRMYCTSPSV